MPKKKKRKAPNWKKRADIVWSLIIRLKHGKCQICNKPGVMTKKGLPVGGLNAHHVIPRGNLKYRHDLRNGQCLCIGCHKFSRIRSPHAGNITGVLAFAEWMQEDLPAQWAWYRENKSTRGKPELTFEEICTDLKEKLEQKDFEIVYNDESK